MGIGPPKPSADFFTLRLRAQSVALRLCGYREAGVADTEHWKSRMTWAIGACNILGAYAALISDVQVTFSDGRTADLVRKAYPVGPYIVGAFAGSVYIGFALLQSISDYLRLPADAPPNSAWEPNVVAEHWAPIAREVFDAAPKDQQDLGAQFLLVGPHPTEDGIPTRAIPYLCKLSSPAFEPEITRNGNSAISIGSGADVTQYRNGIREVMDPKSGLLQAEMGPPGGWAQTLGYAVNRLLTLHPVSGISQHVHIHVALRGEFHFQNSDMKEYSKDGPVREIRMPRVAENYEQLLEMAEYLDSDAATAVC